MDGLITSVSQLSQGGQIALFASLGAVGACIVILLLIKGISYRSKDQEFSIGTGKAKSQKRLSPHATCPHKKDFLIVFHETNKLLQEKFTLLQLAKVRDQMNYADQKADQIRALLQKQYLKILQQKGIPELVGSLSFNIYRFILKDIQHELLGHIRQSFQENHLDELTESSFNTYFNDKFEFLIAEATELLNNAYYYSIDIPREELYSTNQELITKIKGMVFEIYQTARQISVEVKVKCLEIDERIGRLFQEYF